MNQGVTRDLLGEAVDLHASRAAGPGRRAHRAGRALLEPVREALAAWDDGRDRLAATVPTSDLVIGMQTAVGRSLHLRALQRYRELAPSVATTVRLVLWTDVTAGLAYATRDVAFVWLPLDAPGIDLHPVAEERRCVALPAGHRLAARPEVPFAELLDEPFFCQSLTGKSVKAGGRRRRRAAWPRLCVAGGRACRR